MKRLLGCWVSALLLPLFCVAQPEQCRTVRDVPYREAGDSLRDDPMCRLDLVCPAGAEGFPTVVWFHGGGLTGGRREIPEELLAGGFAVAGVEYRLSPQTPVAGCLEDAAAAVAWVVRHIASYGGAPELIFLAGHSAGGYLVSMLGLDKRWLAAQGLDPDRAVAAVIPYSGQAVTHFTRRAELGMPAGQPLVDDMAPLFHVRADAPPMLLLSGDRELEMLGRYEENAYFWRMLRIAGHPDVRLLEFDGYDHGNMPQAGHPAAVRYIRGRCDKIRNGR